MNADTTITCKEFTINDKRMILTFLLEELDQIEITKILHTGKYNTPTHNIIIDWYGNITYNGKTMFSKTVKGEYVCNLETIIGKMNDLKNGTDKQSINKMNSLHYCILTKTIGSKLQKIISLFNLHEIAFNFALFDYKLYQCCENLNLYIIEMSYKYFKDIFVPEHIMIYDNYLTCYKKI